MATEGESIQTNRLGLYIAIPCYFAMLVGAAVWANRRNRRFRKKSHGDDELTAHYLGGRDFGPILTCGTMFAGWFSGYTIVGVPNEAYRTGWLSLRWMAGTIGVVIVLTAVSPRLQKAGLVRGHQSSVDFLTDRFRSQLLRYAGFVLQLLPSIIYLAGQCTAIRTTFNSIFGINPNSVVALLVIAAVILIFEFVGGLASVALTDSIQAFLMMLCFIMLSSVIKVLYGGWTDLNYNTYPKPQLYQTPEASTAWLYWSFVFTTSSLFTLPPFFQRTYAARSPKAIKAGLGLLCLGPFVLMLPAIFVGTMSVQILAEEGVEKPASPFAAVLESLMVRGGFPYAVAVIAYTASLAAIMSTADSVLIGCSHLVTVECLYPLMPTAAPKRLNFLGRIVSFAVMVIALCISIFSGDSISDLASIQFGLSLQIAPAFLIGLFATERFDWHPFSIFAGAVGGFITTLCMQYIKTYSTPFDPGFGGFLANIGLIFIGEILNHLVACRSNTELKDGDELDSPDEDNDEKQVVDGTVEEGECKHELYTMQPLWDKPKTARFGKVPLTSQLMWEMMDGIKEPFTESWAWTLLFLLLSVTMSPFGVGGIPPLSTDGTFAYPPGVVRGIPAWAMSIILYSVFATVILLGIVWQYPSKFPSNEAKMEAPSPSRYSFNPNTLNMSAAELNTRSKYDATNEEVVERRSSLLIKRNSISTAGASLAVEPTASGDGK